MCFLQKITQMGKVSSIVVPRARSLNIRTFVAFAIFVVRICIIECCIQVEQPYR